MSVLNYSAPPAAAATALPLANYPPRYTRVTSGSPNARSTLHAVLDYDPEDLPHDSDDYYDDQESTERGPVALKNGSVPVLPLYAFPAHNNGTLVQVPILWTALSLALGLEIRGDIIRGIPCIKRYHQLFCPTAGTAYPIDRIELFIDENKALMKRMYGEFQMSTEYGPPSQEVFESQRNKRGVDEGGGGNQQDRSNRGGDSIFNRLRTARQTLRNNQSSDTGRVDACQSKVEIVTPYWAANSAGKVRAIVNTQHFEQAIHQEVCSKVQTGRCSGDCGCEQKYKWHRLLAYDPDNDCKGIFMDWFLFPSCCVCRCAPTFGNQ